MSDPQEGQKGPYNPNHWRSNRGGKIRIDDAPGPEEVAQSPHKYDAADRFSHYTQEQIDEETRNVRLDISFGDPLSIRDQCQMIIEGLQIIIARSKERSLGSTTQRIEAHREADSLRRALARFNGKKPRRNTLKRR